MSEAGRGGLIDSLNDMTEEIETALRRWAEMYHTEEFIVNDPVQFPHRFTRKQDIEVSGLLTAIMSFGNRKQIISKANLLHDWMGDSPYLYVMSDRWREKFAPTDGSSFYRMLSHSDMYGYFCRLKEAYSENPSLEDALNRYSGIPMQKLCRFLEVSEKSPQKKLNMFLRWMVRKNSPVDFGIWRTMSSGELIIPLDTHVCRVAHQLQLTRSETFSLKNAKLITEALEKLFPGDPCMGDFALFGCGVNGII